MKKILLRSKTTPFDVLDPLAFLNADKCSSNLGNLLYQHAVYKHLSTKDQEIHINNNSVNMNKVDYVNNNFDHFVIPLANAFRPSFELKLKSLTKFISKLKIPVSIVGVGIQTDSSGKTDNLKSIDSTVREFLNVVLDKSPSIGVRGEFTQEYIEKLGYKDKSVIIGCPSLFTFPQNISKIEKLSKLPEKPALAMNISSIGKQSHFSLHLERFSKTFSLNSILYEDVIYIPQETRSLKALIFAENNWLDSEHHTLSKKMSDYLFSKNMHRFFLNSYSWFHFLENRDLTFGTRLHGCISSLIAGTPAMLFVHDSRTLEIAKYFKIPFIELSKLENPLSADQIYDALDFNPMKSIFNERLKSYAEFLRSHNISTIVDNHEEMKEYDEKINEKHLNLIVKGVDFSLESIASRFAWIKNDYDAKISNIKKQLDKKLI